MSDNMNTETVKNYAPAANVVIGIGVAIMTGYLVNSIGTLNTTVSQMQRTLATVVQQVDTQQNVNVQQAQDLKNLVASINNLDVRQTRTETRQDSLNSSQNQFQNNVSGQINAVRTRQDALRKEQQAEENRITILEQHQKK